ncbi:alpha/beta-hydrolase family protein [Demequina sediminicola]|uniref:alpha/beta-hydrolase family protein n=1 Tax=Demequina sediminicola TaxID=1095026 RepID=UPI000781D0BE|nr:alpha/beta-hydrolase family protein [Demequina sediminicola]
MTSWAHRRLDVVGSLFAVGFVILSVTPSLLPRPSWGQGLVTGLAFTVGYGLGVLLWRTIRLLANGRLSWDASAPAWIVTLGTAVALLAVLPLGIAWQNSIRTAVGVPEVDGPHFIGLALGAALGLWLGFAIGRSIRRLHNRIRPLVVKTMERVSRREKGPRRMVVSLTAGVASTIGTLVVVAVAMTVLTLLLDWAYGQRNGVYDPEYAQPTSSLRSGSPTSLVSWDNIGQAGVKVVSSGPTTETIEAVTGVEARDPIRVYVGVESAPTLEERAAMVVAELERTGAADRGNLLVAGTTGTGWLDPAALDSYEYLHAGNTAIATLQYGTTPSPVSAILTPDLATDGTSALFEAVHAWWSDLPVDSRPRLTVYGLSLGSYGMNGAFASQDDLLSNTEGAVLAGTPSFTALWQDFQDSRDQGSPYALPVLNGGEHVRWTDAWGVLETPSGSWNDTKVTYLQHGNDPIVWIGPSVIWSKPTWLEEGERSDQISEDMVWIFGVTAFQGVIDLILSQDVPEDAGHKYGNLALDALHEVSGDADLSDEALERIRTVIATYDTYSPITQ